MENTVVALTVFTERIENIAMSVAVVDDNR